MHPAENAGMRPHPDAIPNAEAAGVPAEKLVGYALNPEHPRGGDKARVFKAALGYTAENADELMRAIREALPMAPAQDAGATEYGHKYTVDLEITAPAGTAVVCTGWPGHHGESAPRLTSLCVAKPRKP